MSDINQNAQKTVDALNALLGKHGPFYVYAMITNPSTDQSALGAGKVTRFFVHPPNKRFRVGVEITFDGNLHTTPSGAGGKITEAVRNAVGMPAPKPNNNFDGWNRLWFVMPSNVYNNDNPRWLRMRFRVFLTRSMREAKVPFVLPQIKDTMNANDIYTVISSSAGDSVVTLTISSSTSRRRKRVAAADDNDNEDDVEDENAMNVDVEPLPAKAAAAAQPHKSPPAVIMSSINKRLKLVPPRLQRYMTALYTLSGTSTPDDAMGHIDRLCPDTLVEQLGIGISECRELQRTAKMMLHNKKQGSES
jgi:hypothetical protein